MIRRLCIALAVFLVAAPAARADSLVPVSRLVDDGARQVWLVSATGRTLDPNEIQVIENGHALPGVRVTASTRPMALALVIDASSSMTGAPLKAALRTARALAAGVPPNVQIAIYRFNSDVAAIAPFGTPPADAGVALRAVATSGDRLYDAVARVISDLSGQQTRSRVVVVLSDGADNGSDATVTSVAAAASLAGVKVFTVGLSSPNFDSTSLQQIAAGAGGTYSEAPDAAGLARLGKSLTSSLTTQYAVAFTSNLTAPGATAQARIAAPGFESATVNYGLPTTAIIGRAPGFWQETWVIAAAAAIAALAVFSIALLVMRSSKTTIAERVAEYHMTARAHEARESVFLDDLLDRTEQRFKDVAWAQRFALELDRADIAMRASQLGLLTLAGSLITGLSLALAFRNPWAIAIGLLVPMIVWAVVRHRASRRMQAFQDQLADNLAILAQSLRAGFSLLQAIDSVAENASEPSRSEFRRVIAQTRLGGNLDVAMEELGVRMQSRDFDWVIAVVSIQSRIGGNMAEILDSVAVTILERQKLRREVTSLTAQGRMTQWILTLLPIAMAVFLYVANPDLMHELLDRTLGVILLVAAAAMTALGAFLISRIVRIDI